MSRRNPSSRSASSPKVDEKVCIPFSSCSTPRKGLSRSSRHLKPIFLAKDLHQVLKPKKLALGMPPKSLNAASNITQSTIAFQDSSRMTTTFNAHCTGHCTVEDFNVNFANHDAKSVRYRTVLCAWYHVQERNVLVHTGSWNCNWDRSALQSSVRVSWTVNTRSSLAWENNGVSQTGVTLFYTINPFGFHWCLERHICWI